MGTEKVMAKEICQKNLEKTAGWLPEDCAEACGSVAAVEERPRGQETSFPWDGLSKGKGSSSNIPVETDDVDNSSLDASSSISTAPQSGVAASPAPTEDEEVRMLASGGMQAASSSEACTSLDTQDETSWKIEINVAKRKLMENILLYKEEKLDSIELFGP